MIFDVAKPIDDVESIYGGMEEGLRKQAGNMLTVKPKEKFWIAPKRVILSYK